MSGMGSHQAATMEADRWLTPRFVLDALGHFDLDPCGAPDWRTADTIYTPEEHGDGLSLPWFGRVWCNPPYGRESAAWLDRLAAHGRGTALIFARTETAMFFEHVWEKATLLLFLKGRLTFLYPDGTPASANGGAPNVLVAYGEDDARILRECVLEGARVVPEPQDVRP